MSEEKLENYHRHFKSTNVGESKYPDSTDEKEKV